MMETLEEDLIICFEKLNHEDSVTSNENALTTLSILSKYYTLDFDQFTIDLLVALTFNDKNGLINFIGRTLHLKTHSKSLEEALNLILYTVNNFREYAKNYFDTLNKLCVRGLKTDVYFNIKIQLLNVLRSILSGSVNNKFNVKELVENLKLVSCDAKISDSVLANIISLLGFISSKFPECVSENKSWFLHKILTLLNQQQKLKNTKMSIVGGCFEGINGFLINFNNDNIFLKNKSEIYSHMKANSLYKEQEKHSEVRKVLDVFTIHSHCFQHEIYNDYPDWLKNLRIWISKTNREDRVTGFKAISSLFHEIAEHIVKEKPINAKDVSIKLMNDCLKIEKDKNSFPYVRKGALVGISKLIKCFSLYESKENVTVIFQHILKRGESMTENDETFIYFNLYLECLSNFISYLPVTSEHIGCLLKLSAMLVMSYPKTETYFKLGNVKSLENCFYVLNNTGLSSFENYMDQLMYQCLSRICTHPLPADVELEKELNISNQSVSYQSYLTLWKYLLNLTESDSNVLFITKKNLSEKILDSFIKTMFIILRKLDLEIIEKTQDIVNLELEVEARRPTDFLILVNMVDLFTDITKFTNTDFITKWILKICTECIKFSYKRPLVSGFIKILSATLEICNKTAYFKDNLDRQDVTNCAYQIKLFINDKITSLEHCQGDLQVSILNLILSTPVCLIKEIINKLIPAFEIICQSSSSSIILMEKCIDTLECWFIELEADDMELLLQQILPYFDMFLQSFKTDKNIKSNVGPVRIKGKITKRKTNDLNNTSWHVQKKLILFLGKIDSKTCSYLVKNKNDEDNMFDVSLSKYNLPYFVPFGDMKPKLNIDEFVPRCCELALGSCVKQTKFAACELVHSFVILSIGNLAQMDPNHKKDLMGMFKKLTDTSFKLAAKTNEFEINQIFQPLVSQMCHYFSGKNQVYNQTLESTCFLEVLFDCLISRNDSNLRDYCGDRLQEFVLWLTKQKPTDTQDFYVVIKGIFRYLYSYALDPCSQTRLGAAVAFIKLNPLLREDQYILKTHWIEFYYHVVSSIKVDECEYDSLMVRAVRSIIRPFTNVKTRKLFEVKSSSRRIPAEFDGGTVKDIIRWTWRQTHSYNSTVRRVCIDNLNNLLGDESLKLYEVNLIVVMDLDSDSGKFEWFPKVLSHLEYTCWILGKGWVTPQEVVEDINKVIEKFYQVKSEFQLNDVKTQYNYENILHYLNLVVLQITTVLLEKSSALSNEEKIVFISRMGWLNDLNFWKMIYDFVFVNSNVKDNLKMDQNIRILDVNKWNHFLSLLKESDEKLGLRKLERFVKSQQIDLEHYLFLNGLRILKQSGVCSHFHDIESVSITSCELLEILNSCLFKKRKDVFVTAKLDPNILDYMKNVMSYALTSDVKKDTLLNYISRNDKLVDFSSESTVGAYFLNQYKDELFDFMSNKVLEWVQILLEKKDKISYLIIDSLIQYINNKNKHLDSETCLKLSQLLDRYWTDLSTDQVNAFSLVKNTIRLFDDKIGVLKNTQAGDWLLTCLKDLQHFDLETFFNLLPTLTCVEEVDNKQLYMALATLWKGHVYFNGLPVQKNTTEHYIVKHIHNSLLYTFQLTGSLIIIKFIFRLMKYDAEYYSVENVKKCFVERNKHISDEHWIKVMEYLHETCFCDLIQHETCSIICERFLSQFLTYSSKEIIILYFKTHFRYLVDLLINKNLTSLDDKEIYIMINSVVLLKTLFSVCEKDEVTKLADDCCGGRGREKMAAMMNTLADFKYQRAKSNKLLLAYLSKRFNTLSTIVTNLSGKNLKPYSTYLFRDDEKAIWHHIISDDEVYNLLTYTDKLPERKKILTDIRSCSGTCERERITYISQPSQSLFQSSLHEDVTKFDFTYSSVRPSGDIDKIDITVKLTPKTEIELEIDDLNRHECTATICGVIQHMIESGLTPLPQGQDVTQPPVWLSSILNRLPNATVNSKLYMLRILLNLESFLKCYAEFIIPSVLPIIVELFQNQPSNYFLGDLISMLLRWHPVYAPDALSTGDVFHLVKMLIKKAYDPRKNVMDHNMEVIKTLIEVWKKCFNVELVSEFVFNIITGTQQMNIDGEPEPDDKNLPVSAKIQICGILLANKIPTWVPGSENMFFKFVLDILKHDSKHYTCAAQICGLILQNFQRSEPDELFKSDVLKVLREQLKESGCRNFYRIYNVHKHYPQISSYFVSSLVECAWKENGVPVKQCLEMLLTHVDRSVVVQDDFLLISVVDFVRDLGSKFEISTCLLTFKIVEKILGKIPDRTLHELLTEVFKFSRHQDSTCKETIYRIARWACDNLQRELELNKKSKRILLEGLTDEDVNIQRMCFEFFDKSRLPSSTCEKLKYIFSEMYDCETEEGFLQYTSMFLFSAMKNSPDYNSKIFNHALGDCEFQLYKPRSNWRLKSTVAAPLFTNSLASQVYNSTRVMSVMNSQYSGDSRLRATVESLLFEPTLPSASDTDSGTSEQTYSTTTDEVFKVPQAKTLKRRFRSDADSHVYFAKKMMAKKKKEEEDERERRARKENEVVFCRDYRIGDYPDVEIQHSELINPLEAMAKRDVIFCTTLFVTLFTGITNSMKEDAKIMFKETINNCITTILHKSSDVSVNNVLLNIILQQQTLLDSNIVARVAYNSSLNSLGALIIESSIVKKKQNGGECSSVKRRKLETEDLESDWLYLAEMYQDIGEVDVLRGIFIDDLVTATDTVKKAVRCESLADWHSASEYYRTVLNEEHNNDQCNSFYMNGFFNCLSQLSKWDLIRKCILDSVDNRTDILWKNSCSRNRILHWFVSSEMMLCLSNGNNSFIENMNVWTSDDNKIGELDEYFTRELAVYYCLTDKLLLSRYNTYKLLSKFLNLWNCINTLQVSLRSRVLQDVKFISETFDIVQNCFDLTVDVEEKVQKLTNRWKKENLHEKDDLKIWDFKILLRKKLFYMIQQSNEDLEVDELRSSLVKSDLVLVQTAIDRNNFHLARRYLDTNSNLSNGTDVSLHNEWSYLMSCLQYLMSEQYTDASKTSRLLRESYKTADKLLRENVGDVDLVLKVKQHLSKIIIRVSELVSTNRIADFFEVLKVMNVSDLDAKQTLQERGLELLLESVRMIENSQSFDNKIKGEAYLNLAKFCINNCDSINAEFIVEGVLKSMITGNEQSCQLFCYFLQMDRLTRDETLLGKFQQIVELVPTWVFIKWINQMLAALNTDYFVVVSDILLRISKEYPSAVVYNFRLSKETFVYDETSSGKRLRDFVHVLDKILNRNALHEKLMKSLSYVGPPELMLTYYLNKLLKEKRQNNFKIDEFIKIKSCMMDHLFVEDSSRGDIFNTINKFRETVEGLSPDTNLNQLQNFIVSIRSSPCRASSLLKSYCVWLSEYQSIGQRDELEIPGQYDGASRPCVNNHVTISSFKSEVTQLVSKCKPICLTIVGNNAKRYKFMIKFGEDLRQDQRIIQTFEHMNHVLNKVSRRSECHIDVYRVVPLGTNYGMIEWVDNTISLENMITCSLEDKTVVRRAREDHFHFLDVTKSEQITQVYLRLFSQYGIDKTKCIAGYNNITRRFDPDLLKKSYWKLSNSPEHFMLLRCNFAYSQGVMFIAHWLLGIGDRHLQNTLVSTKTGRVLGIDFGVAFGFATQFLTPPELLPFRLTPQIMNLMEPFGYKGWIKETMLNSLRCLQQEQIVLLTMLQVFVQEPSLDWLELAKKQCDEYGTRHEEDETKWYPNEKIKIVQSKLNGVSPVECLINEVRSRLGNGAQVNETCVNIIRENREIYLKEKLTVDGQVNCLLSLATDEHVLSKTYIGWDPWL